MATCAACRTGLPACPSAYPTRQARRPVLPLVRFQNLFPQADRFGSDLDVLIVANEFDGLLEVQNPRRNQADGLIGGRGAHVRELLFLDDVDVQIGVARVFADQHAFINFRARCDENLAALLQIEDGIARGLARAVGYQRACGPHRDVALPFDVAVE